MQRTVDLGAIRRWGYCYFETINHPHEPEIKTPRRRVAYYTDGQRTRGRGMRRTLPPFSSPPGPSPFPRPSSLVPRPPHAPLYIYIYIHTDHLFIATTEEIAAVARASSASTTATKASTASTLPQHALTTMIIPSRAVRETEAAPLLPATRLKPETEFAMVSTTSPSAGTFLTRVDACMLRDSVEFSSRATLKWPLFFP